VDEAGGGYVLQKTGRYAHTSEYVEKLARQHRFADTEVVPAGIRKEKGEWVKGRALSYNI